MNSIVWSQIKMWTFFLESVLIWPLCLRQSSRVHISFSFQTYSVNTQPMSVSKLLVYHIIPTRLLFYYRDKIKTEQIVKSLSLKISARDSRHTDSRVHLKALFDQWLPLSGSLLAMVVDKLPSPQEMISERVEKLMCSGVRTFDSLPEETQSLKNGMFS